MWRDFIHWTGIIKINKMYCLVAIQSIGQNFDLRKSQTDGHKILTCTAGQEF
jgi:hypothetical protein